MTELIRNNLKILGTTTSAGGLFQNVNITGECQFNGDVDCQKLSLTGQAHLAGSLRANETKITGECIVNGSLHGFSLRGRGEVKAEGLRIDRFNFSGNLDVKGDCEAEVLKLSGAVSVEGLLSADRLDINLYGPSWAKEVGGSVIRIKRSKGGALLKLVKNKDVAFFKAGLIEGDNVELQYTKADIVRGKDVIIGTDCEIERVEYRGTLKIHKNAKVELQVKL